MTTMEFKKGHILPTVRIQKIILENFKSVTYGEVLFNCGRKTVPQDTESDILGIYGQNGSGKTAVIEALYILQHAMRGWSIDSEYSECISEGAEYSKFSFTFDLQYPPDNKTRTVTYAFKMGKIPNEAFYNEELRARDPLSHELLYENNVKIYDEEISAGGFFNNSNQKMQVILSTFSGKYPIGPVRKISQYVGEYKEESFVELEVNKRSSLKTSKSFIFAEETMELFYNNSGYSEYFQVLMELSWYAQHYLFVISSSMASLGGGMMVMPLFSRKGSEVVIALGDLSKISQERYERIKDVINGINQVLPSLVTGLTVELRYEKVITGDTIKYDVKLYSKRNDCMIPLRDESAGLIRIISILSLIISAFNERSITVAIDELDAGVYEYLLGEILSGLETYGKGQFIFTSHNLRPLEVLKKESIIFTTTNPENRYIRLKGVGHTNNLRSLYLREILGDSQDEQIYDAAKRQRMIAAFLKAGGVHGKEK